MPPVLNKSMELSSKVQNKKIIFDDEGDVVTEQVQKKGNKKKKFDSTDELVDVSKIEKYDNDVQDDPEKEEDFFAKRERLSQKHKEEKENTDNQKKWFNVYPQYPSSEDMVDMKENEQMELYNLCKGYFEAEMPKYTKRNPSDARWLQTALQKGTAKDRANAGALLVTSNPIGNLEALSTLIGFTKISNKSSSEVISILTDLWKEVLLPPHRKLYSLQMRGADWRLVRKDATITKDRQKNIYAHWYFESELKDHYFEFLKNLQQGIQTGQENNKNASIVSASQLLSFAPEKEQMLLTMLINKLGDPVAKVASKALHHLSEVAHKHPNMCGVIVTEAEKLLFRNNISERAQHFALCFLSSIAPSGRSDVCTKLVNICFALFKVLVQKGAVNNRTMQAILRCLQKAILEAKPADRSSEILSKDMQDTVYRLVHLADIRVSVQTLGLLLQLITVKSEKSDRFYNALYKKLLDLELTAIGVKTAAQLLHIIHRAIHIDANIQRAQAFIKRLLQLSLYMPPNMAAGCLIVIHKLLRSRKELVDGDGVNANEQIAATTIPKVQANDEELAKFDSDGEEKYEDICDDDENNLDQITLNGSKENKPDATISSSWHHAKVAGDVTNVKVRDMAASKYDPYHRVPAYAGAEFSVRNELLLLRDHFHPTVQVFADNILNQKRIDYYGDPLRDFGLPHFLERFAFKNPKKLDNQKPDISTISHKHYVSFGGRGKSVQSLTKANCTEDEMFIFNFLEQKRKQSVKSKKADSLENEEDMDLKAGEVNDNEFEEYLDGFFGKKAKAAADLEDEDEMDFLKELGGELKEDTKHDKKLKKKKSKNDDGGIEDVDADWGDEDDNDDDVQFSGSDSDGDLSADEDGSIDLDNGDDDDSDGSISLDNDNDNADDDDNASEQDSIDDDDDEDLKPPKSKKSRNQGLAENQKSFAKKLKHSTDMSKLFAAADDFAELLEETGKTKGHGTSNEIFNKDKSSAKQLKWEEKRHSNQKTFTSKKRKNVGAIGKKRKR